MSAPTLETLPAEILFHILSYAGAFDASLGDRHPLFTIAAQNKHLRDISEEYTRILLKKHANITPPKTQGRKAKFVCRKRWVKWISNFCQMCKRKTTRRAILDRTMACCANCDRTHFPKMTMSAAIKNEGLTKLDLFTPNVLHPDLPPLSVGEYYVMGGMSTMIADADVLARKELIHGRLCKGNTDGKYLTRRNAAHERLILHLGQMYRSDIGKWVENPHVNTINYPKSGPAFPVSMRTQENRAKYVKEALEKEWAAMEVREDSEKTVMNQDEDEEDEEDDNDVDDGHHDTNKDGNGRNSRSKGSKGSKWSIGNNRNNRNDGNDGNDDKYIPSRPVRNRGSNI